MALDFYLLRTAKVSRLTPGEYQTIEEYVTTLPTDSTLADYEDIDLEGATGIAGANALRSRIRFARQDNRIMPWLSVFTVAAYWRADNAIDRWFLGSGIFQGIDLDSLSRPVSRASLVALRAKAPRILEKFSLPYTLGKIDRALTVDFLKESLFVSRSF